MGCKGVVQVRGQCEVLSEHSVGSGEHEDKQKGGQGADVCWRFSIVGACPLARS